MNFKITKLSVEWRVLIAATAFALLMGYGVALLKTSNKTSFSMSRMIVSYRGDGNSESLNLPKTYEELLQITHAHLLSVPLVYFLLAGLFLGTRVSSRIKTMGVVFLFGGFFVEYFSLWGLRYLSPHFVWSATASHCISGPAYLGMVIFVLRDCFAFETGAD